MSVETAILGPAGFSLSVLIVSVLFIAMCGCGRNSSTANKEAAETVETRAVIFRESPQLANKQMTAATLNGEVMTGVQVVTSSGNHFAPASSSPVPPGRGTSAGEQYYAVVQQDEEMYAEIESANSSVTYARIEPRQNAPSGITLPPVDSPPSPASVQTVVDGTSAMGRAPAPPTIESLQALLTRAHSRQASTLSIFANNGGLFMVSNGQNSSIPIGSDINIVSNLYSTVDSSQKHQRRISSEGHSGDSVADVDQLCAKVSKKSERPSPPPELALSQLPASSSPPNNIHHLQSANMGSKFEDSNHIGSMLPPMSLKRKSSRASREDVDDDPCYEIVGGAHGVDEEPKYERLKGSASSDIDPNYEQLNFNEDPCYEALGGLSNTSDNDPGYERVSWRESDVTDPKYERIPRGYNIINEPRYETVRLPRDDSSDVETDPCYERVGSIEDSELHCERARGKPRREDSLSSDPGYETDKKPNNAVSNGHVQVRMNGRPTRTLVTANSHMLQEPDYETVKSNPLIPRFSIARFSIPRFSIARFSIPRLSLPLILAESSRGL
ncbi:uncharacterized protein LOC114828052 [Galendromus occidentalis]|uniref:Uncharacterized protein LOC114828052 n=1 Tax=Galendromus occidentalis TaxID=34638 RepID=A0AAJ7SD70_9ACAR|nr:uncharacterized protein LOC114828052 [Galendromus occidentalis]